MTPGVAFSHMSLKSGRPGRRAWYLYGPLLALVLAGFGLRLLFWLSNVYHTDEFITMLAAKMVAGRGLPVLPSGLFYDHGLLYSFLSGALVALLGFEEQIARWPALLAGVVTIGLYYAGGRRLFGSPAVGLLAAGLVAFDELSLKWSAWARMYSLAHLFVLLSLVWLLLALFKPAGLPRRYLFLLFLALALFSHTLAFFIIPPLVILSLLVVWREHRHWLSDRRVWGGAGLTAVIMVTALLVVALGHVSSTASLQQPAHASPPPLGLEFLRGFIEPGLSWSRFSRFFKFFAEMPYTPLLVLVSIFFFISLYRTWRDRAAVEDRIFLYLCMFVALVILEMGLLLAAEWQKGIYMFLLTFPAFLLLSAAGLARLLAGLAQLGAPWYGPGRVEAVAGAAGIALVTVLWGPVAWDTAHGQTTGDYDLAFAFVREQRQPGDKIMTEHPAAAYLYLEQNDFYANQVTAKVLNEDTDENALVDRYTGRPLIDSAEALNQALAGGHRVWFVVGKDHLQRYYDSLFHQQIFAQMDLVRQFGEKYVFVSRPYPTPVPTEPMARLDGNFDNFIRLEGYSLDLARIGPDGVAPLGLYWRPVGPLPDAPFKVFVQLRDSQGQTISQADHFIFEGLLQSRRWERLQEEGEWLRDTADLPFPIPLPAAGGPLRIYVGLYHPDTFERAPLLNDTSGENAVVIELPQVQAVTHQQ